MYMMTRFELHCSVASALGMDRVNRPSIFLDISHWRLVP